MAKFVVFHLHLDEGQSEKFNSKEMPEQERIAVYEAVSGNSIEGAIRQGFYRPVALVEVDVLRDVFPATNHIDSDWTENPQVKKVVLPARSTSVGDIAFDVEGETLWSVAQIGWSEVDCEGVAGLHEEAKNFAAL